MPIRTHLTRTVRHTCTIILVSLVTLVATPTAALAADRVQIVHQETVTAGPYDLTLGFSRWPLEEGRSFDLLIDPAGGIADKAGTLSLITPSGQAFEYYDEAPMTRHPRQRESWGLDVVSFQDAGIGGRWSIELTVDGPRGPGQGRTVLPFGPLPGPPQTLSWLLAAVPTLLIWTTLAIAWLRVRPGRRPGAWSLTAPTGAA